MTHPKMKLVEHNATFSSIDSAPRRELNALFSERTKDYVVCLTTWFWGLGGGSKEEFLTSWEEGEKRAREASLPLSYEFKLWEGKEDLETSRLRVSGYSGEETYWKVDFHYGTFPNSVQYSQRGTAQDSESALTLARKVLEVFQALPRPE